MIRYQGVLYEYHYQCYLSCSQVFHQSEQMLSYRGIFYSQEIRSPGYSPEVSSSTPLLSKYRQWQQKRHQHQQRFHPRLVNRWSCYRRNLISNEPHAIAANIKLWKLG